MDDKGNEEGVGPLTKKPIACRHFVFASGDAGRGGPLSYGIVARSPGIDEHTVRLLDGHLYPPGADYSRFAESRSLLVLGDTVAFTQARNAGHDGEGRPDSIYSHTVLLQRGDFAAIKCDTRVISMQCPRVGQTGSMPPLKIRPLDLGMDFAAAKRLGRARLRLFLEAAFSGRKAAIRGPPDPALLPGLLSLLPPPLRLASFTTLLSDPLRQRPFVLAQTDAPRARLGRRRIIDMAGQRPVPAPSTLLGRCAAHLARMMYGGDGEGLERLYGGFAALPELDHADRICLLAGVQMYESGLYRSAGDAGLLVRLLDSVPADRAAPYFRALRDFLGDGDLARHGPRYGMPLLIAQYDDRRLDAASFLEMLGRCSKEPGMAPPDLVRALYGRRPADLRSAGGGMLASAALTRYAGGVVGGFAAIPQLHGAVLAALSSPSSRDRGGRERIFVLAAKASLSTGSPLAKGLFAAGAYDLAADGEAGLFRSAVSESVSGAAAEGAGLGALAGASDALCDAVSPALSAPGGAAARAERIHHLRNAALDMRAALARALGRAAPASSATASASPDEQARRRAASALERLDSLADGAGAARASALPPFAALLPPLGRLLKR